MVMNGCPDDCLSKATFAKSKLAPRGDTEVQLTALCSKSKTKQVKPKTTVKRINPITPLEVDNEQTLTPSVLQSYKLKWLIPKSGTKGLHVTQPFLERNLYSPKAIKTS